ncbi:MAG TPA: glycerol-3-phosphate 1-O-acyltransferase PlsY [Sedimentisphaerales bacterium]|nr:glycerol-3-phosphate 1-O-acyltransferase PlsY [Sedimentisphaerales bacterium]
MTFAILIIAAYLLGSVPFGVIIAKAHGKDLRTIGSGNIGATNVARALGRKWAYFCFLLDALKGLVPTLLAVLLISSPPTVAELLVPLAAGVAAILGHIFPLYLKFEGGKGVTTSFGVALGLWPFYTLCALAAIVIWLVVVLIWRYVSLASIIASLAFPLALVAAILVVPDWQFAQLWPLLIAATAIPVMVVLRHRQNIKRLLAGTEPKILSK